MQYLKETKRTELFEIVLKIFHTPNIVLKIYLIIFVILSSGLASYTFIGSFISYFDYEVTTTSRTINENPTLFPKVTICNIKPFTTLKAFTILNEFDSTVSSLTNSSYLDSINIIAQFTYKAFGFNKKLSVQSKKELAHSLNDIMLSCRFNDKKCNTNDFVWKFDPFFGNCYEFNSGYNSSGHQIDLINKHDQI